MGQLCVFTNPLVNCSGKSIINRVSSLVLKIFKRGKARKRGWGVGGLRLDSP